MSELLKRLRELYSRWISGTGDGVRDYHALANEFSSVEREFELTIGTNAIQALYKDSA